MAVGLFRAQGPCLVDPAGLRCEDMGMNMMQKLSAAGLVAVASVSAAGAPDPVVDSVQQRSAEILAVVDDAGSLQQAFTDAGTLADYVAGNVSARQLLALVEAESAYRLLGFMLKHPDAVRGLDGLIDQTLEPLLATPRFRTRLTMLVHSRDDLEGVFRVASELARDRAAQVERFPALAAAVCVVHDTPYSRSINENRVESPAPLDIFDYFVRNNERLSNDLSEMPAELLVHVVDVTEPIEQLEWALATYGRFPQIGDRFFEIDYDDEHFRNNAPKKVTEAGDYCIQSVKKHGGVCADQAYFAESVAKACGIPSCYVIAAGADVSHAWIGFLGGKGRSRAWNFDEGRYEAYQNLRGQVRNPQTGMTIADGQIGVLDGLLRESEEEKLVTVAASIAAYRMGDEGWEAPGTAGLGSSRGLLKAPRQGTIDDRLGLMKLALARCASVPVAWEIIAHFAALGEMSDRDLDSWTKSLFAMVGNRSPDFSFEILKSMIEAERDPEARAQMWEWVFGKYRARPDLASAVRMEQGRLMEAANMPELAWAAYTAVVDNYLNDGPMCVAALRAMEQLLEEEGKRGAILPYLKTAAQKVKRPGNMSAQFASQSNYFKIKMMYANELRRSGNTAGADRIMDELGIEAPRAP